MMERCGDADGLYHRQCFLSYRRTSQTTDNQARIGAVFRRETISDPSVLSEFRTIDYLRRFRQMNDRRERSLVATVLDGDDFVVSLSHFSFGSWALLRLTDDHAVCSNRK